MQTDNNHLNTHIYWGNNRRAFDKKEKTFPTFDWIIRNRLIDEVFHIV